MSFRSSIADFFGIETRANLEQPTTGLSSPAAFDLVFGGEATTAGESINEKNSTSISTVYACTRVIAESIGTIPVQVKEVLEQGNRLATEHSLSILFSVAPNPDMSPAVFFETIAAAMALTGNGYAEIIRSKRGDVLELYPRNPLLVSPIRQASGSLGYELATSSTEKRIIKSEDMIHVPLWGWDGLKGLSPVGVMRQSLGLTMAAQKHGSRYFSNGSRPGGILTPKAAINPAQAQQMREFWEQAAGINQGRVAVLPADFGYQALGMSLEDSQFLETRQFQRNEICAAWRVPPHMAGDTTRMSNGNAEQAALSLLQDTLAPYIVKIEQEMQRKLLPPTGVVLSRFQIKFDLTERLRSDLKTTLDSLSMGKLNGFYSINDGRRILGLNPIGPEGDIYLQPTNTIDAVKFADWIPNTPKGVDVGPLPKVSETKSYVPLIRDSVGRLTARSQRTTEAFTSIFGPSLTAMAKTLTAEARTAFSLDEDWTPATDKFVTEALKSVEHRSSSWSTDLDAVSADESSRIYKSLRVNLFRDAGAALALKEAHE